MHQEKKQKYYLDLGVKYLSNNASEAETKELEAWVSESIENKESFIQLKKSWALTGMSDSTEDFKVEDNWREVSKRLFDDDKIIPLKTNKTRRWILGVAASLLILVAATWIYYSIDVEEKPLLVQTTENIEDIQLSDGSQVNLNRASAIEFVKNNIQNQRELKLKGDAFFDIVRDVDHPFIIKTQDLEVEVLGTSFYINSREAKDEIQVSVSSGTVAVRINDQEAILQENERAVFTKSDAQLLKASITDLNIQALKTRRLIFDNTRLEEVIEVLNRYYHANISIESTDLIDCELESTFDDMSLDSVLRILETSFLIQVNKEGDNITLTGQCE